MHENAKTIVANTTPLIALTAATGSLEILRHLYSRVVAPYEVATEIRSGGQTCFGVDVFERSIWLEIKTTPTVITPYLNNTLDRGEASVIQTALQESIDLVVIDETAGRRVARLCGLTLTGSIGILLKASASGFPISIPEAISKMQSHGVWLSRRVIDYALQTNNSNKLI